MTLNPPVSHVGGDSLPTVFFLGRGYAGHATRFANLQAHTEHDTRVRPSYSIVSGWKEGGLIERVPGLPKGIKGRLRAVQQSSRLGSPKRPDVIWTGALESTVPFLWSQAGPLHRPMVLDLDSTVEQLEDFAPFY